MPFISGCLLADWAQSHGCMDPRRVADLVAEIADALHLIHGQGLIHGDLKPQNILIGDDGRPRLLGFSHSIPLGSPDPATTMGFTPAYAPPEQIQQAGRCRDVRMDMYSLGVILYESLTGQQPFGGGTIQETFQRVLANNPTPPRQLVPTIPDNLAAICLKAMARNPEDRHASAAELASALRDTLKPRPGKGFWKS